MARPRRLIPKYAYHRGQARVWRGNRYHYLGAAKLLKDGSVKLSPAAEGEWRRLVNLWAIDPEAEAMPADELTVSNLCRAFVQSRDCRSPEAATLAITKLLEAHADLPVPDFGPVQFRAWQAGLCDERRPDGKQSLSITTVRKYAAVVKRIWKWGVSTERVPVERYAAIDTVPGPDPRDARPARKVKAAPEESVEAILPFLTPTVRAMVELQRLTGMRPSALFRMTPAQVHRGGSVDLPDVGRVNVPSGLWVYLADKSKTDHRWVVLGPQAQQVLAPFLERGPDARCFSPKDSTAQRIVKGACERQTPKWPSHMARNEKKRKKNPKRPPGEAYTKESYRNAVYRACDRAGVERISPYSLRHSHAVHVDTEFGLDHAQASLGHTSPQTTRRYSKRSFTQASEVARRLG